MAENDVIEAEVISNEAVENYSSIEEETPVKKKSFKIPALIIGIVMIVLGGIGIAITVPMFFN